MTSREVTGSAAMGAEPLGGNVSAVYRQGDVVVRKSGPWSPTVHALLNHLEDNDFPGAPQYVRTNDDGTEVLTYISGQTTEHPVPEIWTDQVLERVGRLIRQFHDAVVDFTPPPGTQWHFDNGFECPNAIIRHSDLAPRNTIVRDGNPVAFIDWDFIAPAPPVWDLAHALWQFVPLGTDYSCRRQGWNAQLPDRPARVAALCRGYGLNLSGYSGIAPEVARQMQLTLRGMEGRARLGDRAQQELVAQAVPQEIRDDLDWVLHNAPEINTAAWL